MNIVAYNKRLKNYKPFPAFDRLCFTDNTLIGARGAALLIEQIVNGALQQQYKTDGRYAGLRESICEVNHE